MADLNGDLKSVGYMIGNGREVAAFAKKMRPFLLNDKAIIRPSRLALFKSKEDDVQISAIGIEPNSSQLHWIASPDHAATGQYQIKLPEEDFRKYELSIPYVRGLTTNQLRKLMSENHDTVKTLRKGLKDCLEKFGTEDGKRMAEIRSDVIDPQLEKLHRNFRKNVKVYSTKMTGITVGTIALSIGAAAVDPTGYATKLLGCGGFGLLANNYSSYQKDMEDLRDNPFYLFWKMGRVKS